MVLLLFSLITSQFCIEGTYGSDSFFPMASWNLFSHIPIRREISTLYFEDLQTHELCYFYLCPRVDKTKINSYDPYNIVRWRRKIEAKEYLASKMDLEKIGYRIHIKTENITMREKWKELSGLINKK